MVNFAVYDAESGYMIISLNGTAYHYCGTPGDVWDEFIPAFNDADVLFLTEIYPAGEDKIVGVEGGPLVEAIRRRCERPAARLGDDLGDGLARLLG